MSVKDYNLEAGLNVSISGINIAEGCAPSGINDAIRQLMADVRAESEEQTQARTQAVSALETEAFERIESGDSALRELVAAEVSSARSAAQSGLDTLEASLTSLLDQKTGALNAALLKAVPVGAVMTFAANTEPEGFLLCNGAEVSRTTYAALFAVVGVTYGSGDGAATFNLPDLTDRFVQGSGTAGTVKAAGLPDHKHTLTKTGTYHYNSTGSTMLFTIQNSEHMQQVDKGRGLIDNASGSNAVYGASATVQPPALTMRYYIKY